MGRKKTKTKAAKTTAPEVQAPAPDQREWIARDADLRILGRVSAATEDEALAAAREQFEDAATVEPTLADQDLGAQAPTPEDAPVEQPATDAPVEQATVDTPAEAAAAQAAEPRAEATEPAPSVEQQLEASAQAQANETSWDNIPDHGNRDGSARIATKQKRAAAGKADAGPRVKKLSALDAAARVLAETGTAMSCQELILAMAEKGYWSSPAGKTPAATLYSALLRETQTKGCASRFIKADRGKFALRSAE